MTSTVVSLDLPWSKWEIWFYSDWRYIQLYYSTYAYTFSIWNFHIKQMIHVVHVYKWYMSCRYTNDTCRAGIQMIYVMHYYLHIIQWNLSKPNLLVTNICVRNRQVFIQAKWTMIPTLELDLKFGLYSILVYTC